MILADSSIWIDHLRQTSFAFSDRLSRGQILCHPFVIGELAMGSLKNREVFLDDLGDLQQCEKADDEEVMRFVDRYSLFSRGIGFLDAHLLASTLLTPNTSLWTRDRRLHEAAVELGLAAPD